MFKKGHLSTNFIDLTGMKIGKWTIIKRLPDRNKNRLWLCECECGTIKEVFGSILNNGSSTSCGCSKLHNYVKYGEKTYKRIFGIWRNMQYRCNNKKSISYKYYGEKGIKICDEWNNKYNFIDWAINNGYDEYLELDRIDFNGNYEPSNCRWVTNLTQQNNRSSNNYIEYNGEIKTITEWARKYNIPIGLFRKRFIILGWSFERTISEPIHTEKRNNKFNSSKHNS